MVGQLIKEFVQEPDHTELREEIALHDFALLKFPDEPARENMYTLWSGDSPSLYKVLFTSRDCAVVETCEMRFDKTRFCVRKIELAEWSEHLVRWVDEGDDRDVCESTWEVGIDMYRYN